jgi:hypothetical protein
VLQTLNDGLCEQIPGVLGARFGLEGFALGPDGGVLSAR